MTLKKILWTIGIIFSLILAGIASYFIKGYRDFKTEFSSQLLSAGPAVSEDADLSVGSKTFTQTKAAELKLRLLGTVLGSPTVACIEDLTSGKQGMFKVGDAVSEAEIVDIQLGRVTLQKDSRRQSLLLAGAKQEPITQISPTEMLVSKRAVLSAINGNINKALTMARVWPEIDLASGKFAGFKLEKIRKGSLVESAGLCNGDIVKIVNGQELVSPQKAIQILRKMRRQPQINLGLLRKNQPLTLKYEIRN